MQYVDCFLGGPLDGSKEPSPHGAKYSTLVARQLTDSGLVNMALYQYEQTDETDDISQRIYRFCGTYSASDVLRRLKESRFLQ